VVTGGATLAHADRPEPGRARLLRHPRVLAGSTLGLAGVGTALVLALGGATSPAAYAITTNGDGSVLVTINQGSALPQANAKLTAMGAHEQVTIYVAPGAAAISGPVTCTRALAANLSGPPLKVLLGKDGTEVISTGQTAGNTGLLARRHPRLGRLPGRLHFVGLTAHQKLQLIGLRPPT
jgi:hypothetical protein